MKNYGVKFGMVLMAFILLVSCKEKNTESQDVSSYIISGTVKGIDNVYIVMQVGSGAEGAKPAILDSTLISNGTFSFKGIIEHVDMANLAIDGTYRGRFMLENSAISMDIDVSKLEGRNTQFTPTVRGSKSHDEFAAQEAKSSATFSNDKYKTYDEQLRKAFADAKASDKKEDMDNAFALQEELRPIMNERNEAYKKIKYDYVKANPSSPVAVYVLGFQYSEGRMTQDELKEFYTLFQGEAKETSFYKGYMTKVYTDNFESLGVGNSAPDFTLKSVDGDDITLSKVNAKFKLVDFWASWCVPCRASFPHLKELYKTYHKEGFEVVGIGTADEEQKWRNAIKEDQTPWIHVYDTSENHQYGEVAKKYGVPFLPTTFLVDEHNTILLRNPSKKDLDAKLKELFGH
ncbi:AhpC/TSA family protein [Flavobacteriaceae bacterium F08102]|nr:AhpC/TSA family protein [Flavobacteriaceae bacterium F08102]